MGLSYARDLTSNQDFTVIGETDVEIRDVDPKHHFEMRPIGVSDMGNDVLVIDTVSYGLQKLFDCVLSIKFFFPYISQKYPGGD